MELEKLGWNDYYRFTEKDIAGRVSVEHKNSYRVLTDYGEPMKTKTITGRWVMMTRLETDRLVIKRFKGDDWLDLYDYLSLEEVVKYEPYEVFNEEECKNEAKRRAKDDAFWAVCLKEEGKLIGNLYFNQQQPREFMTWEIGYVFNPSYYGKGYATETCKRMLKYGFEDLKAHRIMAKCNTGNTASWKLLERLSKVMGYCLRCL